MRGRRFQAPPPRRGRGGPEGRRGLARPKQHLPPQSRGSLYKAAAIALASIALMASASEPSERLADPARRTAGARYALADIRMLRKELVIGFVVAGFLAVGVPDRVWTSVFLTGHGAWSALENAIVGPAVAVVSFVCSIGNVPLAAALWQRGVAFGGVVAFVFADLLSLPLILIYRKLYGGRLTLRLVAVMWVAMSAAGLAVEGLMRAVGGIPDHRPTLVAPEHFAWDHTTILNILAVIGFLALWRIARRDADAPGAAVDHCAHHSTTKAS